MIRTRQSIVFTVGFTALMIVFSLLIALSMSARYGIPAQWTLLLPLVMGVLSSALLVIGFAAREAAQRRALSGKKQANDNLEAQQQRTLEIDLPYDAAFDLALEALQTLDGQPVPLPHEPLVPRTQTLRIYEQDREIGSIRAGLHTQIVGITDPIDFSRLEIRLQKLSPHTTRLRISSKGNALAGEFYDFGKNLHYVKQVALHLRRESAAAENEMLIEDHAEQYLQSPDLRATRAQ